MAGGKWTLHNGFLNRFGAFDLSALTRLREHKTNTVIPIIVYVITLFSCQTALSFKIIIA